MKKTILLLATVAVLFSGCATKSMVVDGKKYTQGQFDSEWKLEGEVKPVDENATKPEDVCRLCCWTSCGRCGCR